MISRYLPTLAALGVCANIPAPVNTATLPFSVGEKLTYEVNVAKGGKVGKATMWIEGPVDVRGVSTYLLRFDSRIRIAFLTAVSRSSSWFDPLRGSSLRFFKHEQNPLARHDESVDFYPDEKTVEGGERGNGEESEQHTARRAVLHVFHPHAAHDAGCDVPLRSPFRHRAESDHGQRDPPRHDSDSNGRAARHPGRDAGARSSTLQR